MQACYNTPGSPSYPTIGRLLSPVASRSLADGVAGYLSVAHRGHLPFRIDEMNTISCGNPPGVPNTFAMALWALDALFALAERFFPDLSFGNVDHGRDNRSAHLPRGGPEHAGIDERPQPGSIPTPRRKVSAIG